VVRVKGINKILESIRYYSCIIERATVVSVKDNIYSTWNMELSRAHHELTFFLKSSIFYSNVVHEGFGFCAFCAF